MYSVYMQEAEVVRFETVAEARRGFKGMLDMAESGAATTLRRGNEVFAVMSVEALRPALLAAVGTAPKVVFENDGVGIVLPGMPFASEGDSVDDAALDLIDALREYAEDWPQLRHAPNHRRMQTLVALVEISTDEELAAWLTGR